MAVPIDILATIMALSLSCWLHWLQLGGLFEFAYQNLVEFRDYIAATFRKGAEVKMCKNLHEKISFQRNQISY